MTKRYALTKFQPRYETQDTLTLYVADTPGDLEEIILSIWEENNYSLFNYFLNTIEITPRGAMSEALKASANYVDAFNISVIYDLNK